MRKYIKILAVIVLFFGGHFAYAQGAPSGHFVLISQGQLPIISDVYNCGSAPCSTSNLWTINIGSGYTGTTTGAFVTASTTISNGPIDVITLSMDATGPNGNRQCEWSMRNFANGTYTGSTFRQLQQFSETNNGCTLHPEDSINLNFTIESLHSGGTQSIVQTYGQTPNPNPNYIVTNNTDSQVAIPYFAIVADGFQITPTASSSGLFLSGAQQFCNGIFGSSTSFGSDIGSGICQSIGYLFVPTPDSIAQFNNIPNNLESKFPFSWYINLQTILGNLSTSSNSVNYPNISFPFGSVGSTSMGILPANLVLVSSTSIQNLVPNSDWTIIRLIEGYLLWIAFAYGMYYSIRKFWHTQND